MQDPAHLMQGMLENYTEFSTETGQNAPAVLCSVRFRPLSLCQRNRSGPSSQPPSQPTEPVFRRMGIGRCIGSLHECQR